MKNDLTFLAHEILSHYELKPKNKANPVRLLKSILIYLKTLRVYNKLNLNEAVTLIGSLSKEQQKEENYSIAKKLIATYRFFGRLFGETFNCLERSICLRNALISFGIPAELVIGKPRKLESDIYMFHAWVEVNGVPVNDYLDVDATYTILQKF